VELELLVVDGREQEELVVVVGSGGDDEGDEGDEWSVGLMMMHDREVDEWFIHN